MAPSKRDELDITGEDSIADKEDPIRSVLAISRLVRFEVNETKIVDR